MWRSIEIRNFRNLEHVKATLAPFTVVVGPSSAMSVLPRSPALADVRSFRLDTAAMRPPQLITERTQLDETGSNLAAAIHSLRTDPSGWADVMAAMGKIIPGVTRIEEVVSGRYIGLRWFQRHPGDKEAEFTSTEMSERAIRAILVAAQQLRPHELLVLEEPEVALHPGAAGVLFDALKAASRRGSVLITTHSPELLDAASDEEILVCDYRKGVTEVGPLDQRQRKLVRDGLFSISEIMRAEPLRIDGKRPAFVGED